MMHKLLIVFVFSLTFGFIRSDDDICKSLKPIEKFKAKSVFYHEGKEYHIEEYQLGERGKLVVSLNGEVTEFYFNRAKNANKIDVLVHEKSTGLCTKKSSNSDYRLHKNLAPFAFFDKSTGLFGPSGLFSLLQGNTEKMRPVSEELERGIESHACAWKSSRLSFFQKPKAMIYISKSDWSFFDNQKSLGDVYLPIALTFEGTVYEKTKSTLFKTRIDYLTFETIKDFNDDQKLHEFGDEEDWWVMPAFCPRLNEETSPVRVPEKVKFVFEELDEMKMKENSNGFLRKSAVVLDQLDDSIRFDNKMEDTVVKIFEPKNKILFEIQERMYCKQYFNRPLNESPELIKLLKDLSKKNQGYFLVGNQMVRNIQTDVYRKVFEDKATLDRKIVSLYLNEIESGSDDRTVLHEPLQIRIEKFTKIGESYRPKSSRLFNFFQFEIIDDNELVKSLDVSECVDSSMEVDFTLVAESDEYELDAAEVKKELREKLVETTGLLPLNFPRIEVKVDPFEVIARVKFIDIVSPLAYFVSSTVKQPPVKSEPDNLVTVESLLDCAAQTLKFDGALAFQHCKFEQHYCDIITNPEKAVAVEMKGANETHCRVAFIDDKAIEKDFKYVTFEEKYKKIVEAVDKKIIEVTLDELVFDRIHLTKEQSEVDTSQLYELKLKDSKFTEKKYKKRVEMQDGIVNLDSCYQACVGLENDVCDSFSFCKKFDVLLECHLGVTNRQNLPADWKDDGGEFFEPDTECDVYTISSIRHFHQHENKKLIAGNDDSSILRSFADSNSAECAQDCLNTNMESENRCYSIEVCENEKAEKPTCRLSSTQTLWGNEKQMQYDEECSVYAIKHIVNFVPSTKAKLKDFIGEEVSSIDQCANACDLAGDCERFNYCQTIDGKLECRYESEKVDGKKRNTEYESDELGCATWVHRTRLLGAPKSDFYPELKEDPVYRNTGKGFRRGSVAALVFLFLFIGLFVGGGAFYGRRKYLNRESRSGESETAISFSQLKEES